MINYMKSEFYRTLRNRNLWILITAFAGLMIATVLILSYFNQTDPKFPYGNTRFSLGNIYMQMNLMLAAAIIFTGFIYDGEDKQHTIKHSVAFGIKRKTIYIGRFLVQVIESTVIYLVLVSVFTVISFMLLTHSNQRELEILIRVSLGSVTCLYAGIAVTHYFLMISESETTAYLQAFSVLLIIPTICNMLGRKVELIKELSIIFPSNVMSSYSSLVTGEGDVAMVLIKSLFIGLVWMLLFLGLGVTQFRKKEFR